MILERDVSTIGPKIQNFLVTLPLEPRGRFWSQTTDYFLVLIFVCCVLFSYQDHMWLNVRVLCFLYRHFSLHRLTLILCYDFSSEQTTSVRFAPLTNLTCTTFSLGVGGWVGSVVARRAIDLKVRGSSLAHGGFTDCGLILGKCHPSSFHPQLTPHGRSPKSLCNRLPFPDPIWP